MSLIDAVEEWMYFEDDFAARIEEQRDCVSACQRSVGSAFSVANFGVAGEDRPGALRGSIQF